MTNAPAKARSGNIYTNDPTSIGKNKKKIEIATPAPELIPIIPGSAKSLRVIPCKMAPDRASAIPAKKVIIILGKTNGKQNEFLSK